MTTIVMNTLKAAVTEYDWDFQCVTPNFAADAAGLYSLGGDTDAGAEITGEVRTGRAPTSARAAVEDVYYGLQSSGTGVCRIEGESGAFEYSFAVRASGVSRAVPGRGIAENYLSFGYRNVLGVDFRLERIEPTIVQSKTRRIG